MLRKTTLALLATAALATAALAPTSASAWTWWDGSRGWYGWDSRYYYHPANTYADEVAYCARRYHSYDPASGTYLGNDGFRHYCP